MTSNRDRIIVTVLEDGTVKLECPGSISSANHGTAEAAIGAIARDLGGDVKIERIGPKHHHHHAVNAAKTDA